jgi:hypothetical protein
MTALVARWRPDHYADPIILVTSDNVAALLDALDQEPLHSAAHLSLHRTVRPYSLDGQPDHELVVGVDRLNAVGSLRLRTSIGTWYAAGKPPGDGQRIRYYYNGLSRTFPADALVPLEDISTALMDFMLSSGCRRPVNITWHDWPASRLRISRRSL